MKVIGEGQIMVWWSGEWQISIWAWHWWTWKLYRYWVYLLSESLIFLICFALRYRQIPSRSSSGSLQSLLSQKCNSVDNIQNLHKSLFYVIQRFLRNVLIDTVLPDVLPPGHVGGEIISQKCVHCLSLLGSMLGSVEPGVSDRVTLWHCKYVSSSPS